MREMNYFEYFDIPVSFQINLSELRKKYYEKSRALHPDLNASEDENSIFLTAYNNQAYQILLDPLSRLKYIIETFNGPIQENHTLLSQEFLLEMMDFHEEVNEAVVNKDIEKLNQFKSILKDLDIKAQKLADKDFKAFEIGDRSNIVFEGLTMYYFKMKYFNRLSQSIDGSNVEL